MVIKKNENVVARKVHGSSFLIDILKNNSDYLQKARKYGHFTGYKN